MKRTAAILLALMTIAGSTQALTVSKNVGPLLQQAQAMIADKNYKAAAAKLDEAETARATPDDEIVIAQMRQFIQVKTMACRPGESSHVIGNVVEPCPS